METAMISVLRQLPRNSRIISAVRQPASDRLVDHAVDRGAHEHRLVERGLASRARAAAPACMRGSSALHAIDDVERGGVAVLEDRQQHRALAVVAHDVGLRLEAVAHVRDVADVDRAAAAWS